jgi:hypothetical protein
MGGKFYYNIKFNELVKGRHSQAAKRSEEMISGFHISKNHRIFILLIRSRFARILKGDIRKGRSHGRRS